MKLYATVTSERASKGQGGKELYIQVKSGSEERKTILAIEIKSQNEGKTGYDWTITGFSGDIVFLRSIRAAIGRYEEEYIKGKKQTGEMCPFNHEWDEQGHCKNCLAVHCKCHK